MPLVVPVLRACMLFQNVWETFKILKPPPPSRRNEGRPSVRAASQRKRDMKGAMTIWIVWCCFATYERSLDSYVRIFIPFYDEIKSVIILGLIFARARLAEPIFLHLIRPVLKPYTPTIDFILEHTASVGDFIALLLSIPVDLISPYLPKFTPRIEEVSEEPSPDRPPRELPASLRPGAPLQSGAAIRTSSSGSPYQAWHPTSLADDGSDGPLPNPYDRPASQAKPYRGPPTPPPDHSDEWRGYPAFPAAYPPTPLAPAVPLASASAAAAAHTPSPMDEGMANTPWPNAPPAPAPFPAGSLPPGFQPSLQ